MIESKPRLVAVAATVVLVVFVAVLVLYTGAQTSTILSTVGAAVSNPEQGQSSGGSTDQAEVPAPQPTAANGALAVAVQPLQLLIVRTGSLTLETSAVGPTVSRGAAIVTADGGFVSASREAGTAADASAVIEYRIPATAWERTLAALRGLGTVRGQEIKADEVTGTVVDLGARIANLRSTEAALQAIMTKATRIADVLDVQKQLTETRGQIEQLTGQRAELQDRAAFGTLTVTYQLPPAPAPTVRPPTAPIWDPGADAAAATARLVRIAQKSTTAGIWVAIIGLPILAVLAVAIGLAWVLYRVALRLARRDATT